MLISGKEAYNAVLDGQEVEWLDNNQWSMFTMSTAWAPSELSSGKYKFRIKPVVASVMTFEEWCLHEKITDKYGINNHDSYSGAADAWDYKQSEIDALQKRIDELEAKREGFVLVPKEPTLKMSVAYRQNAIAPCGSLSVSGYKAMLSAVEVQHVCKNCNKEQSKEGSLCNTCEQHIKGVSEALFGGLQNGLD